MMCPAPSSIDQWLFPAFHWCIPSLVFKYLKSFSFVFSNRTMMPYSLATGNGSRLDLLMTRKSSRSFLLVNIPTACESLSCSRNPNLHSPKMIARRTLTASSYIGCSDSRVPANEIMGLDAGEVSIHRNIANLVPNIDLNGMSVIEYAVVHLHIKHIVVCGHYNCGGIQAAPTASDMGLLNPWLRNIRTRRSSTR
jgi:hypothetical protein